MGWFDNLFDRVANRIADRILTQRGKEILIARDYRLGRQPVQLKVKSGQYDDNLIVNFTGLIANRAVSQLVGEGIDFRVEGDEGGTSPELDYLEAVWDANHQEILLHRAALAAAEAGTGYLLLCDPALMQNGGIADRDGTVYPRLMMLDPVFMTMDSDPEDWEVVWRYTLQYKYQDQDGKERARKREFARSEAGTWEIITYDEAGRGWVETERLAWPWPFAPVVHWQNLPSLEGAEGQPDITADVIRLQDKLNGDISFLSKALRLGISPFRWGKGLENMVTLDIGPDKIASVGPLGEIEQQPPEVEWEGSLAYTKFLRAALFDICRTVDIDSLQDKLGSMTNFALRVIYQDNAAKIATKRELLGDALEEVNRRLLIMAGYEPVETTILWPEMVPQDQQEEAAYHQVLVGLGVESKQSAAEALSMDWETEQERMQDEQSAQDNVGAALLRAFNQGGGRTIPGMKPRGGPAGQNNGSLQEEGV